MERGERDERGWLYVWKLCPDWFFSTFVFCLCHSWQLEAVPAGCAGSTASNVWRFTHGVTAPRSSFNNMEKTAGEWPLREEIWTGRPLCSRTWKWLLVCVDLGLNGQKQIDECKMRAWWPLVGSVLIAQHYATWFAFARENYRTRDQIKWHRSKH